MPNLVHGQDPGGALRPIQVDDNGNLSVDLVSGVNVSATIDSNNTLITNQVSGGNFSTFVTGSSGTTVVVGDVISDATDTEGAPIKVGGIARTANPTAVGAGDRVSASFDDVGRIVTCPYQIRDLVSTGYGTTSTGETVIILGGAVGTFHDLMEVTLVNESTAATLVDILDGSQIIQTFNIPANNSIIAKFPVPIPQSEVNYGWKFQNAATGDISGTAITVSALFIKNV